MNDGALGIFAQDGLLVADHGAQVGFAMEVVVAAQVLLLFALRAAWGIVAAWFETASRGIIAGGARLFEGFFKKSPQESL